jgi:hypothetical protein
VQLGVAASNMGDTVPGGVYYSSSAAAVWDAAGYGFTQRPANITGWYKWNRVGGDTTGVFLVMTKWNTTTQSRDTVAYHENFIATAVTPWTAFTFPINYMLNVYPDSIFMAIGNSSQNPHIGSAFTVDDIAFTGSVPIGINELQPALSTVIAMPNPFSQQATLTIQDAQISNGKFEMYDMLGNKVRVMENISGSSFTLDREGLPVGMYLYTLTGDNAFIASGKLTVE